jgi:hypothetical protein
MTAWRFGRQPSAPDHSEWRVDDEAAQDGKESAFMTGSSKQESMLRHDVYLADGAAFSQASELLDHYGELAVSEAAQRASRSRDLGNVIHFCRWREVIRMIDMLSDDQVEGAIH